MYHYLTRIDQYVIPYTAPIQDPKLAPVVYVALDGSRTGLERVMFYCPGRVHCDWRLASLVTWSLNACVPFAQNPDKAVVGRSR